MFPINDSCPNLPDDIFHKFIHIYRVFSPRTKVFDKPFPGLKMNCLSETVYPFSAKTNLSWDSLLSGNSFKTGSPTPYGY